MTVVPGTKNKWQDTEEPKEIQNEWGSKKPKDDNLTRETFD